jgi:ATP-dependent Clp protease, protease subunit
MPKPWTIHAKAGGEIEILLYEMIGTDWWTGEGTTAKQFAEDLKAAGAVSQIHLRVNSPGGNVFDGIAIYNTLLSHKATVTAQVDGLAASIASVIIMAASEISMGANGMLMIHNPWSSVQGDSNDMRKMADTMDKVRTSMIAAYRRHTKMPAEDVGALMDEETWMTADEAKDRGFAETIIDPDETADLAANLASPILSRFKRVPAKLAALAGAADQTDVRRATLNRRNAEMGLPPVLPLCGARPSGKDVPDEERNRQRSRLELLRRMQ